MQLERRVRAEVFGAGLAIAASPHLIDEPIAPHVHDFVELAVITRGSVLHRTADGDQRSALGDVVVVRPGAWHAYRRGDTDRAWVINAYLGPELLSGSLSWVLDHAALARLLLLGGRLSAPLSPRALDRVMGWLEQLTQEPASAGPTMKTALLSCVLVELSREESLSRPHTPTISPEVRSTLARMSTELARDWTVHELATRAGLSRSSLYRRFRTELGAGPVEWLTRGRAELAATLLVQTDLPVAAIGRRVGWPDPSYASRRFAQFYGVSPNTYRTRHAYRKADLSAPGV